MEKKTVSPIVIIVTRMIQCCKSLNKSLAFLSLSHRPISIEKIILIRHLKDQKSINISSNSSKNQKTCLNLKTPIDSEKSLTKPRKLSQESEKPPANIHDVKMSLI